MFDLNVAERQEYNPWPHSPNAKAYRLVPEGSRVLDVGCAGGHMGRELLRKNCCVVGIESDSLAAVKARDHYEAVIEIDLEILRELPYPHGFFDVILCLDVLEHLARPDRLLHVLRPYIARDGQLIVAVPNIARLEHRLGLLLGKFEYRDYGALSKGHLRFFTLQSARKLLETSGYQIIHWEPTGLGSVLSVGRLRVLPNLLAFGFLLVARP